MTIETSEQHEGVVRACRVAADGWTVTTTDGSLAAHAEHTVVIRAAGAKILTAA